MSRRQNRVVTSVHVVFFRGGEERRAFLLWSGWLIMQVHRGQQVVLVNEKSTRTGRVLPLFVEASKTESIGNRINSLGRLVWSSSRHARTHAHTCYGSSQEFYDCARAIKRERLRVGSVLKERAKSREKRNENSRFLPSSGIESSVNEIKKGWEGGRAKTCDTIQG